VSIQSPSTIPPGWYPDPGGVRQWRVWTGVMWSELTRPYGDRSQSPSIVGSLELIGALRRLTKYGIVATFAGLGLLVNALAHWPGTHQPTPLWFAMTASDVGVALLVAGWVAYALAVRELEGRWTPFAFLPGVNVFVASGLVTERLSARSPTRRILTELLFVAIFVGADHTDPWLGAILGLAALSQMQWTNSLIEQLCEPTSGSVATTS
jgi:hypothetical protein